MRRLAEVCGIPNNYASVGRSMRRCEEVCEIYHFIKGLFAEAIRTFKKGIVGTWESSIKMIYELRQIGFDPSSI